MKKLRSSLVLLLILIVVIETSGQSSGSSDPYFFVQVTDPQFGMANGEADFAFETALMEKAVAAINRIKPDFVVFTGDLVNTKDNISQINEFKRIVALIDKKIPVWYLPGNHDIGAVPTLADIDMFRSNYGHDRFSFSHKNSRFIGLNSSLIKSETGNMEEEQLNWLIKELASGVKSDHTVVFSHYPFFIKLPIEPETYSNIGLSKRKKYLDLFNEYGVDAVFAGHLHNNSTGSFAKFDMITTSAVGKPLADAPSGLRIIKVFSDRIESKYYGLDEIPEIITFATEKK